MSAWSDSLGLYLDPNQSLGGEEADFMSLTVDSHFLCEAGSADKLENIQCLQGTDGLKH